MSATINKAEQGSTLIELMVSLFIVAIVMMGWWRIFNATSPYREAQRRAAVEIAAGLLDILPEDTDEGEYEYNEATSIFDPVADDQRNQFPQTWFPAESPVRYILTVEQVAGSDTGWKNWVEDVNYNNCWAKVELYDGEDELSCPEPFKTLQQLVRVVKVN